MVDTLVPFGKYKGQPVEVLAADPEYCDWLTGQDWFRDRYAAIHTLVINHFGAPSETPEHNALQACFLDRSWVERFVVARETRAQIVTRIRREYAAARAEIESLLTLAIRLRDDPTAYERQY